MLTKITAAILALFIAGIACFSGTPTDAQPQGPIQLEPANIYSADTSVKNVVDSTKSVREEFISQKETIKDKFQILLDQQRRIKQSQKRIDSVINYKYDYGYKGEY